MEKELIIIIIDITGTILLAYLINYIYKNFKIIRRKKIERKIINEKIKLDKEKWQK